MAESSTEETRSAGELLADTFQLSIECPLCTDVTELRQLSCQHMMCSECVGRVLTTAIELGSSPQCPYCEAEITKSATDYPVCRFANNLLSELDQLRKALHNYHSTDSRKRCEVDGCRRHLDMYCRGCRLCLCFRCSEDVCGDTTTPHDLNKFDETLQLSRIKFEDWKLRKQADVTSLSEEMTAQIKDEIARSNETELLTIMEEMRTTMHATAKRVAEEQAVLDRYSKDSRDLGDAEFIRLVEHLSIERNTRDERVSLESGAAVLSSWCYSVTEAPSGHILVGRIRSLDIFTRDGEVVRSVSVTRGTVTSVQCYDGLVYTLHQSFADVTRHVVVYDSADYRELRRWAVPNHQCVTSIAVNGGEVYVPDPYNHQLCVYSLTGTLLIYVKHSSIDRPTLLTPGIDDTLLLSECNANKVHRLSCKEKKVLWSVDVDSPMAVYSDRNGDIWVWSYGQKMLHILRPESGERRLKVRNSSFAELDMDSLITSMCVTEDGTLWTTALSKGLLRFDNRRKATPPAQSS